MDTMTYPILALMGKKRSGKDTVAGILAAEHGFTSMAFADTLREILLEIDPHVPHPLFTAGAPSHLWLSDVVATWGWEGLKEHAEPLYRRLLRDTGAAISRHNPTYFSRAGARRALELAQTGPVVVTDTRFPVEVEAMRAIGARLLRVERPGTGDDDHPTETAVDDVVPYATIYNTGTLDDLPNYISFVLEHAVL